MRFVTSSMAWFRSVIRSVSFEFVCVSLDERRVLDALGRGEPGALGVGGGLVAALAGPALVVPVAVALAAGTRVHRGREVLGPGGDVGRVAQHLVAVLKGRRLRGERVVVRVAGRGVARSGGSGNAEVNPDNGG